MGKTRRLAEIKCDRQTEERKRFRKITKRERDEERDDTM